MCWPAWRHKWIILQKCPGVHCYSTSIRGANSSRLFQHTFWAKFSWVRCKLTSTIWKGNYVLLPNPIHPIRYSQSLDSYWEHSKQGASKLSMVVFSWLSLILRFCVGHTEVRLEVLFLQESLFCMATTELMPAHNNRYWFTMSLSVHHNQQLTSTLLAIIVFTLVCLVLDLK